MTGKGFLWHMLDMLTGAYVRSDMREVANGNPPKTLIGKLFAPLAWGLDMAYQIFTTIKEWDNIDNAAGAALDRYGKNYGVKREGTADDFYRVMIKVKMIAQVSGGDTDTVIQAAAALYDVEPEKIHVEELFPAKGRITVNAEDITPERKKTAGIISRLLKRIVACGVGLDVIFQAIENVEGQTYLVGSLWESVEDNARLDYWNRYPEADAETWVISAPFIKIDEKAPPLHRENDVQVEGGAAVHMVSFTAVEDNAPRMHRPGGGSINAGVYALAFSQAQITLDIGGLDNA